MSQSFDILPATPDISSRLRQIPFFSSLPDPILAGLTAQCHVFQVLPAQIIFHDGDVGESLFIVLDGQVQVFKNLQGEHLALSTFQPGDFFGEMALFEDSVRSATALAIIPTRLLEIHSQTFRALLHTHPKMVDDTFRILSQRLRETNAHRISELARKNDELEKANARLQKNYDDTLNALSAALDLRDQVTQGHSQRVTTYTLLVAKELGVPQHEREVLRLGALLHDIGKIGVPDAILRKTTTLTPPEWTEMRKHPEYGANLVDKIEFLQGAHDIVIAHHEKFDGSGYPYGLRAHEIPLGARIFAVVDVFDAVTTFRPYRDPISPQAALGLIRAQSGSAFDPEIVRAFERALPQILGAMRASFAE